jgi:hypothetical protein
MGAYGTLAKRGKRTEAGSPPSFIWGVASPALALAAKATPLTICVAALARGPLVSDHGRWRFGDRVFAQATVDHLIGSGAAKRVGDVVVRAEQVTS